MSPIKHVAVFVIECDKCEETYRDYEDWTGGIFTSSGEAVEKALEDDWIGVEEKFYCGDCRKEFE